MLHLADDDDGSATVLGAFVIAAIVALIIAVMYFGVAVSARHRVQSAADLSALAGASQLAHADADPCGTARRIAEQSAVDVLLCRVDGSDIVIHATVDVQLGPFGVSTAKAAARAGP